MTMEERNALEKLALTRKPIRTLSKLFECPICLDHFNEPQQLICGHVFCKGCVEGTMRMKHSRCGICKEKVTRRNFRDAPIDYTNLLSSLHSIRSIVDSFLPPEEDQVAGDMQGFPSKIIPLHQKTNEAENVSPSPVASPDPITPMRPQAREPKSAVTTPSKGSKSTPISSTDASAVADDAPPDTEVQDVNLSRNLSAGPVTPKRAQVCEPGPVVPTLSRGAKSIPTAPVDEATVTEGESTVSEDAPPCTGDFNLSPSRDLSTPSRDFSSSRPLAAVPNDRSPRTPNQRKRKKSTSRATPSSKRARGASSSMKSPGSAKYVLCATGLSAEQKNVVNEVAGTKRITVKQDIIPRVTHVICNARESADTPTRTLKLCKAIAAGLPILCYKWIEDASDCAEWPYVDEYLHRYTRTGNNLFSDCRFYFGNLGQKMSSNKEELSAVIRLGGGVMLTKEPSAISSHASEKLFIVEDSRSKRNKRRSSLASLVDRAPGVRIIEPTWILDQCTPN